MKATTIRFGCTNCGSGLQADSRAVGFDVECPGCGEILVVPGPGAKAPPRPEPQPEPEKASAPPPPIDRERLVPKVKFCISCSRDVAEGELICPQCGGGRFGRL